MNLTEFLAYVGFKPYASVVNSWDSFKGEEAVLMQLWQASTHRIRNHATPGAYLRTCCFDAQYYENNRGKQTSGFAGRLRAIEMVEAGALGYAAISNPPAEKVGAGIWAKYASLDKVYPILEVEREKAGTLDNVFVILGEPVLSNSLSKLAVKDA